MEHSHDLAWNAPHAGNPLLPGYCADPSVIQHAGRIYIYATLDPWGGRALGCWESVDWRDWTFRELNWPTKEACMSPTSNESMVWAPSVVRGPDGRFYMYVSVGSEVWVGVADAPFGPWRDANRGRPLIPATWNPRFHMIDAEAFIDDDGTAYLYWGSGWNWVNGACFAVRLEPDMLTFSGEARDVTPPRSHYFEGPFMVKRHGRYLLMYSAGKTISDTYCVYYATGASPFGPFIEAGNSPILTSDPPRRILSPGHHAVFQHESRDYIIYHRHSIPFEEGRAFRQLCVDELVFTPDGRIEDVVATHIGPPFARDRFSGRFNLAALDTGATAIASSSAGEEREPNNVLDDNYATRWVAASDAVGGWLQLDLGAMRATELSELRFEYPWKRYPVALLCSQDAQAWETAADHRADGISGSPIVVRHRGEWRYLRLIFAESLQGPAMSLFEWQVF